MTDKTLVMSVCPNSYCGNSYDRDLVYYSVRNIPELGPWWSFPDRRRSTEKEAWKVVADYIREEAVRRFEQ